MPEGEDFISELSDDILVLILAHTPTRTAVSTSVLSKRWRNLYKSLSSFNLCCTDLYDDCSRAPHDYYFRLIMNRLKRFLRLYSGSKIYSFSLRCCLTESRKGQYEECIYSLGKLGVEELHLSLSCCVLRPSYISFPCHLLSKLPSLKYLSLTTCSLQPSLKSKCYSLQTLAFQLSVLVPGSIECILSNCLSLHSLTILRCHCPPKLCFRGPNIQLKTLIIRDCEGTTEIQLYASNLTLFEWKNRAMVNFVFDYVPQLESMYFELPNNIGGFEYMAQYVFGELPKHVPRLKSLTFNTGGYFYKDRVPMGMETFGNLRRLAIFVACEPRTNLLELTPYLESCPLLEELQLNVANMDHGVAVQRMPVVLVHTKLKKVEMFGVNGVDNEIKFALYILKTAVALEQMFIMSSLKYYGGDGKLMVFSRPPWSEETLKYIVRSLQDQAVSNKAKLIIHNQS